MIVEQGLPLPGTNLQPTVGYYGATLTAVVKDSKKGSVFGLHAINGNAAIRYIQIYDQANGAPTGAPVAEFLIEPSKAVTLGAEVLTMNGLACTKGIVFGFSTTRGSYVAATGADHSLTISTK